MLWCSLCHCLDKRCLRKIMSSYAYGIVSILHKEFFHANTDFIKKYTFFLNYFELFTQTQFLIFILAHLFITYCLTKFNYLPAYCIPSKNSPRRLYFERCKLHMYPWRSFIPRTK